jgi:uncharacterized protein YggE
MRLTNMTLSLRSVVLAGVVAVLLAVTAALAVVAANRPPMLVTTSTAGPGTVTTSASSSGIITGGDATVSKRPDVAFISVGVESLQSTAAAAQSDLATKAGKLIARAKSLGVADKDLNTSGYWVGPNYTPGGTINGYRASEDLQIKWHNVDTTGKTLDALVQEGGATHVSVGFGLADPKAAQSEARALAIADARSRAQTMAAAAGVKVGSVVMISDLSSSGPIGATRDFAGAAIPAASQLPVGQLDIQVTVEVDFAISG